jgi:hypothetical protein
MPTEAVTGTHSVSTSKHEEKAARASHRARKQVEAKAAEAEAIPALADPNGNGSIQVVCPDGSIKNFDGAAEGWEDEVRALDPKHQSLRNT